MILVDSHFHYDLLPQNSQDELKQIGKSLSLYSGFAGISAGVWPSDTAALCASLSSESHELMQIFLAGGLHPEKLTEHCLVSLGDAKNSDFQRTDRLHCAVADLWNLAEMGLLSAIGETGFDRSQDMMALARKRGCTAGDLLSLQWQAFECCLEVAIRFNLPVIFHSRGAWAETLRAVDRVLSHGLQVMIHCYPGHAQDALALAKKGVYLSFGGVLTWPQAKRMKEAFSCVALERLLFESDAPDLAPHLPDLPSLPRAHPACKPLLNTPLFLGHTIQSAALLRSESGAVLAAAAEQNFYRFLGLSGV